MDHRFDYWTAFSRNVGWVTETEQALLRARRIAIAGVGGVGGSHLLTLTRLGIGGFHIADLDTFELANFNRQAGASLRHLGRPKVDVLAELALDINPELDLRRFPQGVGADNVDEFLDGVDLYVDGLDFFAVEARRLVFARCAERGIPAVTAAPLGMGVALLNFLPGRMTFEEYFRLEGQSEDEQLLRFLLGLSPAMLQRAYLVDPSRVDLAAHKGPSTPMACELCAGMAATHALKILLRRGKVPAAPWGLHFDAYRNRFRKTWRPGGNRHPLQRLALKVARRQLLSRKAAAVPAEDEAPPSNSLDRILDLARWAPSGDNTQPWRFEVIDDRQFVIHAHDTRDWCVYDLDGHASQIAIGALLETIAIAASGEGLRAVFERKEDAPEHRPLIRVILEPDDSLQPDVLLPFVRVRSTQRRPLSTRSLTTQEKDRLEAAVAPGFRVVWLEGTRTKWRVARLLSRNAKIRLTIPEAYEVHRRIIEWDAQFSRDRIPDQAVGMNPLGLRLMRWAMARWERVRRLNRYAGGTWLPRIELDFLPAVGCAAHFLIVSDGPLRSVDDYLAGGRAVQRFWLTATALGLQLQPEMTPLIFSRYVREARPFSRDDSAEPEARRLVDAWNRLLPPGVLEAAVFMGRIGEGRIAKSRSLRLPMSTLNT